MSDTSTPGTRLRHRTLDVEGTQVFLREAGNPDRPALVLLPGHPSAGHAYIDLATRLATDWYVVVPDYPGYGFSPVPEQTPTFDSIAAVLAGALEQLGVHRYVLYMFDFGAPVGMRIALAHPDRVAGLVVQNGNIALEGLGEPLAPLAAWWSDRAGLQSTVDAFLSPDGTRAQWQAGLRDVDALDPALPALDVALLHEPGRRAVAEALLWDYQTNPTHFDDWQQWIATTRPPLLVVWGARDPFFPTAGAEVYRRLNPDAEVTLLDTGHFALVEELDTIATKIDTFLHRIATLA